MKRQVRRRCAVTAILLIVVVVVVAGCGSSVPTTAIPRATRQVPRSALATPPPTIFARAGGHSPYRALKPGTVVPARFVGARSYADSLHGFGLALVGGEGFPAATDNGGGTWRINGPVFFADAADGAAGVSYTGSASRRTYFAYGSSAVDVTTDGGRRWWTAYLGEVVLAVVAKPGELVAVVQQTPSGKGSMTANSWVYVSTDGGRRWRYDAQLDANVPPRRLP